MMEKVKPKTEDPLTTIGKGVSYIFGWFFGIIFLLVGLGALFSSFLSGLIMFFVAAIIIPPSRAWLENRFEWMRFRTGVRVVIVIVLLIIAMKIDSGDDSSISTSEKKDIEPSPEEVIKKYAPSETVKSIAREIAVINSALNYSSGYNEDYIKQARQYLSTVKILCSKYTSSCRSAESYYTEKNQKVNLTCAPCPLDSPNYSFVLINVSQVEENGNESIYNVTYSMDGNVSSTLYKLEKIDGEWKVVNRKISGEWITEKSLAERDKDLEKIIDLYKNRTALMERYNSYVETLKAFETELETVVGEGNIIDVQFGDEKDGTLAVSIWYYFSAEWLTDDYLEAMDEAAAIYKYIYTSEVVSSVKITTIELYRDEYGNVQQRTLAESSMDKSTAAKINWEYFESQNLDDITHFEFYQDSLFKSLEDLQEELERSQDYYEVQQAAYQDYMSSYYGMYS